MLLVGRFSTGFGAGAYVMVAPAYVAEIAEDKYRGLLGTLMQLMLNLGILFVYLNCSTDWRLVSGLCIVFPALLALWMFWMPRSPVFLVSKGDVDGAKKSLQFLRGKNANVDDELEQIKDEFAESQNIGSISILEVGNTTLSNLRSNPLDFPKEGILEANGNLPRPDVFAATVWYQLRGCLLRGNFCGKKNQILTPLSECWGQHGCVHPSYVAWSCPGGRHLPHYHGH